MSPTPSVSLTWIELAISLYHAATTKNDRRARDIQQQQQNGGGTLMVKLLTQ